MSRGGVLVGGEPAAENLALVFADLALSAGEDGLRVVQLDIHHADLLTPLLVVLLLVYLPQKGVPETKVPFVALRGTDLSVGWTVESALHELFDGLVVHGHQCISW